MGFYLCSGIFIFIFLSINNCFSDGFVYKDGNFQLFHKHPNLRSCAESVLQNNEYVGGRVSNLTGECQGLPYKWALNQTIQSGYAYAKKRMVREVFKPPINLWIGWIIPGLFQKEVKLEVTFTMPSVPMTVAMTLFDETKDRQILHLKTSSGRLEVGELVTVWSKENSAGTFSELSINSKVKISFEPEEYFIKILLNDTVVYKHYPESPVNSVRSLSCWADREKNGATLSSIMYTNE